MSKRSVISVCTGQCGVQTGRSVLELYAFEHDIDHTGNRDVDPNVWGSNFDNFRSFFYETAAGKFVPKSVFIDSDPCVMDELRASSLGSLIKEQNMISYKQDCRNVFGLAWNKEFCGFDFHENMIEKLRICREFCDTLSGNMYFLSGCGGSGPGFASRALQTMNDMDQKSVNYSVCQSISPSIVTNTLETFNSMAWLGFTRYDNLNMNMHTFYDNEALYRMCYRMYGATFNPTYSDLNQLVAASTSTMTASLRFDGQLNTDLNEFETNLVPMPLLNNMFVSMAPLDCNQDKEIMSTREITMQAFAKEAFMNSVHCKEYGMRWVEEEENATWEEPGYTENGENDLNYRVLKSNRDAFNPEADPNSYKPFSTSFMKQTEEEGLSEDVYAVSHKFLASFFLYRGDLMPASVNRAMQFLNDRYNPEFVAWAPTGFKVGISTPPMKTPDTWRLGAQARTLTCVHNNTVISERLKQIVRNYRFISTTFEGFRVWNELGGVAVEVMDQVKEGLCQQIKQYETCMSKMTEIEDVKNTLGEEPVAIDFDFSASSPERTAFQETVLRVRSPLTPRNPANNADQIWQQM